jgi:TolB-like protein
MSRSLLKLSVLSVLALGGAGVLSACHTTYKHDPFGITQTKDLQEYSHDAADDLMSKARFRVAANTPILVGTLNHVDKLERSSTFGRIVAEQVSSRFAQRGFAVSELKMRQSVNIKQGLADPNESGEFLLSRDISAIGGEHKAAAVVTGTYAVAGNDIFVNLKMIDVATGKLISATDYNVPLDSNIRALVENDSTSFYGASMAY